MEGKMPPSIVEDVPQKGQLLGPIYPVNDISLAIKQGETYRLLEWSQGVRQNYPHLAHPGAAYAHSKPHPHV